MHANLLRQRRTHLLLRVLCSQRCRLAVQAGLHSHQVSLGLLQGKDALIDLRDALTQAVVGQAGGADLAQELLRRRAA